MTERLSLSMLQSRNLKWNAGARKKIARRILNFTSCSKDPFLHKQQIGNWCSLCKVYTFYIKCVFLLPHISPNRYPIIIPPQICRQSLQKPWRWCLSVLWLWQSSLGSCPRRYWFVLRSGKKKQHIHIGDGVNMADVRLQSITGSQRHWNNVLTTNKSH